MSDAGHQLGIPVGQAMRGLLGHVGGDSGRQAPDGDAGHKLGDLCAKPGCWPWLGSPS